MDNPNNFKKYRVKTCNILKAIDRRKRGGEEGNRKKIKKANLRSKKKYIRESIRNEAKRSARVERAQW